jgi:hypothetical protein
MCPKFYVTGNLKNFVKFSGTKQDLRPPILDCLEEEEPRTLSPFIAIEFNSLCDKNIDHPASTTYKGWLQG